MIHLHKEAHLLVLQEKLAESLKKLAEIEVESDLRPQPKNLQSQDSPLEVLMFKKTRENYTENQVTMIQ